MARGLLSLVVWALVGLHVVFGVAADEQKAKLVSSVSVEGLVFCDQCLQDRVTKTTNPLKGAKVAVVCGIKSTEGAGRQVEVVALTDAEGKFKAEVPKSAFDSEGKISCAAELRESPLQSCKLPGNSRRPSQEFLRQEGDGGDTIIYAAGEFSYRPNSAALLCAQDSYYPPVYKPPMYKPPMYKPPVYKPPVYKPPVYKPPMYKPPVYKPPVYKPPMYKPPVYKPPVYKPPMYKPPAYKPPMYKPPVYKPPVYTPPKYNIPKFKIPKFQIPKFKFPKFKYPGHPP